MWKSLGFPRAVVRVENVFFVFQAFHDLSFAQCRNTLKVLDDRTYKSELQKKSQEAIAYEWARFKKFGRLFLVGLVATSLVSFRREKAAGGQESIRETNKLI
jgi:hypothetical protein